MGWIVGRNVRIDYRWGAGEVERYRAIAADLVSLAPDAVLALGYATVSALQKATRSVPIVFVEVIDPVGGSLVASLARPGGNTTGFLSSEFGFSGKWLELLKESQLISEGVWVGTMPSYLEGASMSPREGGAMNRGEPPAPLVCPKGCCGALAPR